MNESIIGMRFSRLVVIAKSDRTGYLLCQCDCGTKKDFAKGNLKKGSTRSCGCIRKEKPNGTTHGQTGTLTHKRWISMHRRCSDVNLPHYSNYGGRGIKVCARWESFENFRSDMGDCTSPEMTLDRIDSNGNYEPDNCRWATRKQQNLNTRRNRLISFNGETMCVHDWAIKTGIKAQTILNRLRAGWSVEKTLTYTRDARENNGRKIIKQVSVARCGNR